MTQIFLSYRKDGTEELYIPQKGDQ